MPTIPRVSYEFYKVLHVVGIILVFMTLGASILHAANGGTREQNTSRKLIAALSGIGLLLIIVAGFGMLARIQSMSAGIPGWVHPKLLIWLLIAAAPSLIARKPSTAKIMWLVLPLLGAVAAYLGINHK